jgi:peptide/nickel transport system permease protein
MTVSAEPDPPDGVSSPLREHARFFVRHGSGMLGLGVLLLIVAASLAGPALYGVDPFDVMAAPLLPPGTDGLPLGSDYIGRDILAGLLQGGRVSLLVGVLAAVISTVLGTTIGSLAGFYGGRVDQLLMSFTEFFQVLPALVFAMALVTLFSPSLATITIVVGVVSWTGVARLTRAEFLRIRELDFVRASRAAGASDARLIWRVILPNAMPPLMVASTLTVGIAILFEGGLSFLGLGDPNVMSWGLMIGSNRGYMLDAWWAATIPGAALFLAVLSISLIGDGLNDALNPSLRQW